MCLFHAGCYDSLVYVLRASDGKTYWTFSTGNSVKSCATVDPESGLVFIGSHDHHTYALDVEVRMDWALCVCMSISLYSAVQGGYKVSWPYLCIPVKMLHSAFFLIYIYIVEGSFSKKDIACMKYFQTYAFSYLTLHDLFLYFNSCLHQLLSPPSMFNFRSSSVK